MALRKTASEFLSLIPKGPTDYLLWDLPLTNTAWELWDRSKSKRQGHVTLKKGEYTPHQLELIQLEDHFRKMYLDDRQNNELKEPFSGLVSVFENFGKFQFQPLDSDEISLPMLLKNSRISDSEISGKSAIVDQEKFQRNFGELMGHLSCIDWSNVFVAGGAVLGSLLEIQVENQVEFSTSDVDVFFYGLDVSGAANKLAQILGNLSSQAPMVTFRSKHAVTVSYGYPKRNLQFILRNYLSAAEILQGFDIDSCAIGFDGKNVWAAPRAVRAITKRYNLVNLTRRSPTYEYRLFKYSKRGFGVMIPRLDGTRINPIVYTKTPSTVKGLAKLIVYDYDATAQAIVARNSYSARNFPMGRDSKFLIPKLFGSPSDYTTLSIPYGPRWTWKRIEHLLNKLNYSNSLHAKKDLLISAVKTEPDSEEISRFQQFSKFLNNVPWVTVNPGAQGLMTGSFQPLTDDDWEADAYFLPPH
eukprot:TRINITY_DN1802_c1_g1_i1.p2 TRINITY_DN1802_c1_g1~~TRINITY_DN1802_c1_g1_i1.p2  ORF type:complete len:471 (-),score=181.89 TRINITY_DN1802_c1_g1_i1:54-1466(-)